MKNLATILFVIISLNITAQSVRERTNFDSNWYFAFGHPYDKTKDFNTGTGYFTYLAKAGYGDGAAAKDFDHRAWRPLDLPHDWAVEMPFSSKGSHSHGYKAVGPGFPETSVGWYRKSFFVNSDDYGKQLFLDFDGISRNAQVWVNGHYLGTEPSGYQSFNYNITDIINYGEDNVVAVRADVSMEEGWYYEGAGIYRHVWLRKTASLHIPKDGTFVHCNVLNNAAEVIIETEVENRGKYPQNFILKHQILNKTGAILATKVSKISELIPMQNAHYISNLTITNPQLWSIESPYIHTMLTQVISKGKIIDEYQTKFGIRTILFDANKGFFLNGKHVKLKGTNNHQDHAGVGSAMPDELIRWRLQQLKNMGSNAYRCSHNPPTPELLNFCDEMGIVVIDENRLMGTTKKALHEVERLIKRDRNHPSVIVWSLGNEEWGIECNVIGEQIVPTMQNFAKTIDSTRPMNVAISGGCHNGISSTVDIVGYNYLGQWDTDKHHSMFPDKPSIGTEEGSTYATRGIYVTDDKKQYKKAYDLEPRDNWYSIEEGWKHYAERDYLAGMFIWTGFDYRGESTPYSWPSVTSYFGMMDLCGFPKDNVFYLKSWWQDKPVLHILPHWNWQGREGDTIDVWVYSNCNEVELQLNGKNLGKKKMEKYGHLEWKVPYNAGTIKAIGYKNGKPQLTAYKTTTKKVAVLNVSASKTTLKANNRDVSLLTIKALDKKGNIVPTTDRLVQFEIEGPGKIIGVGNGNPTSTEKECFSDTYNQIELPSYQEFELDSSFLSTYLSFLTKEELSVIQHIKNAKALCVSFNLKEETSANDTIKWFYKHVANNQFIYLNQNKIIANQRVSNGDVDFVIDNKLLTKGKNNITIIGTPFKPKNQWDHPNKTPGIIQIKSPAEQCNRKLFNGLAQAIIQSSSKTGKITINVYSNGIKGASIELSTLKE